MEILPCQKILTGRPEGNYKSIISLLVVIVKFNWRLKESDGVSRHCERSAAIYINKNVMILLNTRTNILI